MVGALHLTSLIMTTLFVGTASICGDNCQSFFKEKDVPITNNGGDAGEPLYLSPYIERGDIFTARLLSKVGPLTLATGQPFNQTSYSGLLTVNKAFGSNMFFWFFPAQTDAEKAPVLLWLQGGPGGSSMFGIFVEHGPLVVVDDIQLQLREVTWNSKFSILYIDNPVGSGFSYTEWLVGYSTDETDVALNLYSAVTQFFKMFPEYLKNDFYVAGESYAGKYVPAITHKIHTENPRAEVEINLKGMAIGDGFCDPVTMIDYGEFLYNAGLVNERQKLNIQNQSKEIVRLINMHLMSDAFDKYDELLLGLSYPSYYTNVTGMTNYYNILRTEEPPSMDNYYQLFSNPDIRRAMHVGNLTFGGDSVVAEALFTSDFMDSVKPWVVDILNADYKALFYNGQLDVIVAYPMTESFLKSMQWKGRERYLEADRHIWKMDPSDIDVAGYAYQVDNMYQVLIKGGGHIIPYDQPERTRDAIERFISGRGFND